MPRRQPGLLQPKGLLVKEKTPPKEKYAGILALIMVVGYLILPTIPMVLLWASSATSPDAIDLVKTVAAVLGGPVGAVLGYYYRVTRED
jgi:hypothetical protein